MTSGSYDFFLTLNVWSFKSRHVELGTFEIPVVGGVILSQFFSVSRYYNQISSCDLRVNLFHVRLKLHSVPNCVFLCLAEMIIKKETNVFKDFSIKRFY